MEQARALLKISAEERQKDSEALELYQERVKELELMSVRPISKPSPAMDSTNSTGDIPETIAAAQEEDATSHGLGSELDDAGVRIVRLPNQWRKEDIELGDDAAYECCLS